jgi:threonine/homoserine/homoserine lactone efflux protein
MILGSLRDQSFNTHLQPQARNPFWQGVMTEVLNPKTAIFFLAFIPQFVDHSAPRVFWQFLMLGSLSVFLNTSADLVVTLLAAPISMRLKSSPTLRRRQGVATGLTLIGLGTFVAISDSR